MGLLKKLMESLGVASNQVEQDTEEELWNTEERADKSTRSTGKKPIKDKEIIVFPATQKDIGEHEYDDYKYLRVADLSKCTKVETIGDCAFRLNINLETVILPPNLKTIGQAAFYGCDKLKEIDFSHCPQLEHISDSAFSGCSMTSVDLSGTTIKFIESDAFAYNKLLNRIILPETLVKIGENAFRDTCLTEIVIPDSVEYIDKYAFSTNKTIVRATIGRSLKDFSFLKYLFNLKELTIRSEVVEHIDRRTLTKVTFCDTVKELGKDALAECEELEEVVLPDSVTKIGSGAFKECFNLSSIVLSDNITEMGSDVLHMIKNVKEIVFPRELRKIGSLGELYNVRKLDFSKVTNLKVIPEKLCARCHKLKELIIPIGVTEIEDDAFSEMDELKKLFLPPTLETIGEFGRSWGRLSVYCFAPSLEELEPIVYGRVDDDDDELDDDDDELDDEDEEKEEKNSADVNLFVLPQYLDSYMAQRKAEQIPENVLAIKEIPEELRYYYDN